MFKVLLMGLWNNTNLGDRVIADCTYYLTEKILKESGIEYCIEKLDIMDDSYDKVKDFDFLLFVGGGIIKYKYQEFYRYIDRIIAIAEDNDIPVVFNAVGVEGYDENDEKCRILKRALNKTCVKYISVRDDINTLNEKYIQRKDIITKKVADPAVWTYKVYNKEKQKSNVLGLGVIREGVYGSNGIDIKREEIFEFWSKIIFELEKNKTEWKIFTNGYSSDMKFAINLMKYIHREDEIEAKIIAEPTTAEELVNIISSFKAVIVGRLHASIVSYSLNIPAVGIVWNDKCKMWGENIGYPQRYFDIHTLEVDNIVKESLLSMREMYDKVDRREFENSVYYALKEAIGIILHGKYI